MNKLLKAAREFQCMEGCGRSNSLCSQCRQFSRNIEDFAAKIAEDAVREEKRRFLAMIDQAFISTRPQKKFMPSSEALEQGYNNGLSAIKWSLEKEFKR